MSFFDELYDRFHELHADIAKAVDGLPVEALDWIPGEEMNPICVLVVHSLGAERYWIGDVALGETSGRVREEEFNVHSLTVEELKQRIEAVDAYARQALAMPALADLDKVHRSPRNEKTFTTGWCLTHALEHTALHTGQIQLTRQLWEQRRGK